MYPNNCSIRETTTWTKEYTEFPNGKWYGAIDTNHRSIRSMQEAITVIQSTAFLSDFAVTKHSEKTTFRSISDVRVVKSGSNFDVAPAWLSEKKGSRKSEGGRRKKLINS